MNRSHKEDNDHSRELASNSKEYKDHSRKPVNHHRIIKDPRMAKDLSIKLQTDLVNRNHKVARGRNSRQEDLTKVNKNPDQAISNHLIRSRAKGASRKEGKD